MQYRILNNIKSSRDVSLLENNKLKLLSSEIRDFLITEVSKTGGHLSANLGTVEICVGFHKCFKVPRDKIVFDVGHQGYTHKILTGRKDEFKTLRKKDGLSGFPAPKESDADSFISGHGSTSLSVAIGLAKAKKIKREAGYVVAVVGDGAFTGGMIYEGLNNIDEKLDNLIIILNDNKMSISKNVGAMSKYLSGLRASKDYLDVKEKVSNTLERIPVLGKGVSEFMVSSKSILRRALYNSTFFEDMGLTYHLVEDGNDIEEMCTALNAAKRSKKPTLIHALTVKGKGFTPAETNPGAFHGVSAFDIEKDISKIEDPDIAPSDSYSNVFGQKLAEIAAENNKICAITAAMKYGTGLQFFYKQHKNRFFDVGMAEEHAVTFASALSVGGLSPVVCLYSTFMQRALDQYLHDVMLMKSDVLFAIDRAGLVPGDGETHQGVYDLSIFANYKETIIASPSNYSELKYWLEYLINEVKGAKVIRYPRGGQDSITQNYVPSKKEYDIISKKSDSVVICYGRHFSQVIKASEDLFVEGIYTDICKLNIINPISDELIEELLKYKKIFIYEEQVENGSVAKNIAHKLLTKNYKGSFYSHCIDNNLLTHASVDELMKICKLDSASIARDIKGKINEN